MQMLRRGLTSIWFLASCSGHHECVVMCTCLFLLYHLTLGNHTQSALTHLSFLPKSLGIPRGGGWSYDVILQDFRNLFIRFLVPNIGDAIRFTVNWVCLLGDDTMLHVFDAGWLFLDWRQIF